MIVIIMTAAQHTCQAEDEKRVVLCDYMCPQMNVLYMQYCTGSSMGENHSVVPAVQMAL